MKIIFATGNAGKVTSLRRYLERNGVHIAVEQQSLELIEPQANTAEEVARVKAELAWKQLGSPVLVDDSSFHIAVLNGFPGPYIKPMLEMIGVEGIMQLMRGRSNRAASFISSLVYIDENGAEHVFDDDPYTGIIAEKLSEEESSEAWSDLYKIFIPDGQTKVLAELTIDERHDVQPERIDAYGKFVDWIKERNLEK